MIDFFAVNGPTISLVLSALVLILLIWQIRNWQEIHKLQALKRRLDRLVMVDEPVTLGELLNTLNGQINALHDKQAELDDKVETIHTAFAHTIVRTGLVRFDAFGEGKEPLSFALCLLDPDRNGIMMTGIRSLSTGSLYAKEIVAGVSREPLSPEETKALQMALGQ